MTHRSLGFVAVARSPVLLKDARGEQTNKKQKTGNNCLFLSYFIVSVAKENQPGIR